MSMHAKVLGPAQKQALRRLAPVLCPRGFYLAGGTAVALHLGHRKSEDLDWLTAEPLADPLAWVEVLRDAGCPLTEPVPGRGVLHGSVAGVRVSLLQYSYPLLEPLALWPAMSCQLASLTDLAAMKLLALTQRGLKRDFVDVYALALKHRALPELAEAYCRKFRVQDTSTLLYGLTYYDDAEKEARPRMLWKDDWPRIKKSLRQWVREMV